MLDTDTKRKIDTARDILVGKVPDPKSQVEQITIALIYKFMDDMDKEAVSFGGKATFFTEEYEQYSWTNIFDTKIGGHELLALYSEALLKLNLNPNIPQLFRDIFKNAYLPYRDPETLKLFLKTINGFSYDHSEMLGDAFEYLLSVLGSQGDAGQFRTPRHIIDFMVEILQPKKNESILDPACGTAGFLISSYKHILKENTKKTKGDLLTPDDRKKMMQHFVGYDISPDMVRLSLVNLYLHGFTTPCIYEYDTLTSEDRWNEYFDVIIANPPFMTPKGGIKPHKKFTVQANRSEVLFVDYIAEHIHPSTGRAGIIIPEGIIFQSAAAYKALRKMLVEKNMLYAVVSLPAGIFQPYSGVKTSILLMDKTLAKKTENILFVKIDNDGFDLGAQRRAIDKNDLTGCLELLQQYKTALQDNTTFESDNKNVFLVDKERIAANADYNLSIDRYRVNENVQQSNFEMVRLEDVCEINPDTINPNEVYGEKNFIYLDISSIKNGSGKYLLNNFVKGNDAASRARRNVKDGDVLLSTVRPNLKAFVFLENPPDNVVASTGFAVLRFVEKTTARFIYELLFSDWMQNQMIARMGKGAYPSINLTDIQNLQIPLPPLSIQQQIVTKIESYQKIIDGSKQVTENYKPQIDIDASWEMVKLGEMCKNLDSKRKPVTKSDRSSGRYPYYGASGIVDYVEDYIFDGEYLLVSEDGANLLARVTPIAFSISGKNWVNNHAHILQFEHRATQTFIEIYLNSIDLKSYITGAAQPKLNQAALNSIPIPLPPISVQQEIVKRIEVEQALVNSNKKLIEFFGKKIKDEINKLWQAAPKAPALPASGYAMQEEKLSIAAEE
ncbi:MAG: N-6 DNA methylase [Arcicella sp.]|nr:N-6 DNA methylase [Arcicella sp.]